MRTEDHVLIADALVSKLNVPKRYKKAFILGNRVPDLLPSTYMGNHYIYFGQGHSFPVRRRRLYRFLSKSRASGTWWWYRFGVQIHYLTDSFSRPHNPNFRYNSRDHVAYEIHQHELFPQFLRNNPVTIPEIRGDIASWINNEHREYMKKVSDPSATEEDHIMIDCFYVVRVVTGVWRWVITNKVITV